MTEVLYFLLGLLTSAIGGAAVGYLFAKKGQKIMNERQNADGTWSKAEPIKASWETNRLLQLFKKIKRMFR